jgi:hypothetical protein
MDVDRFWRRVSLDLSAVNHVAIRLGLASGPYESQYFMMIIAVYATLGIFLIRAAGNPQGNRSLIWFTIWSSLAHAAIMAVQSVSSAGHMGHLLGDVPALVLIAIVLAVLMPARPAGKVNE